MLIRTVVALVLGAFGAALAHAQLPDPDAEIVQGPDGLRADSVLKAAEAAGFNGVALVARHGAVVLQKGYGMADRAAGTRMMPGTVVQIGSNTKDFTALAILQLIEQGRLRATDPLARFFPHLPAEHSRITVGHLLRHEGGLPSYAGLDFELIPLPELIARVGRMQLRSVPGERSVYSNAGYSLLGAIVEQVSGQSYETYVRDHITTPLGLRATGYLLPGLASDRVARSYIGPNPQPMMLERPHLSDGHSWTLRANGGLLSTVGEMYRFYQALAEEGRLVGSAALDVYPMFRMDRPVLFAGSDRVNLFVYNHDPLAGFDLVVASTSTPGMGAFAVREALAALFEPGGENGPRPDIQIETGLGGNRPGTSRRLVIDGGDAPPASTLLPIAFPDTPIGRAMTAYFRQFNQGDAAALQAYLPGAFSPGTVDVEAMARRYESQKERWGTIIPLALIAQTETRAVLQVATSNGPDLVLVVETEVAAPHRLTSFAVLQ